MRRFAVARAAVSLIMLGEPIALAAQNQTVHLAPTGGRVAIWNLLGTARIEQGTGSDVEVQITPSGADAAKMIMRNGDVDGVATLRIFYPADNIRPAAMDGHRLGRWSTSVRMRDDGRFNGNSFGGHRVVISNNADFEASANLVIRVPASIALDLHVAHGDVSAVGATTRSLTIDTYGGNVRTSATRGVLDIDTGSGDAEVKTHSGDLSVDTGSGSVDVSDVDDATTISLDTGSGAVIADRCKATDQLRIDTGSGRVIARNVQAREMSLDTGSGSVEVSPTSAAGSLHVDTGSGSVTLIAPSNFGAELEISAGSGGIRSELPLADVRRSDGELSARIGDGRARISIDTGSGGVSIRGRL
jgi:hypothetical protein